MSSDSNACFGCDSSGSAISGSAVSSSNVSGSAVSNSAVSSSAVEAPRSQRRAVPSPPAVQVPSFSAVQRTAPAGTVPAVGCQPAGSCPAVRLFNGRCRLEVLLRRRRRGYIGGRRRLRSRRCEFESRCLLGVDGTIHGPVLRRQFRLHVVKVTNCRLDSSHREGARIVDDPGFFCLSGGIDQSRATNVLEFFVRRIDYPLQVGLQVFDKRSGLGGNCGQLSRPQPAGHPRSAVNRRPEGRDLQRFLGSSPEALTRRIPTEDCHRPSLPSSPVPLLRCCWLKTAGELCE